MGVVNLIGATAFERDLESFHSGGIHSRYDTFVSGASVAPLKGNYLVDKSPIKPMPPRILATAQALALLCRLRGQHGALLIHQSGGRSVPLCFKQDEFRVSSRDVLLGVVEETPFYVGAAQTIAALDFDSEERMTEGTLKTLVNSIFKWLFLVLGAAG
jgi:hypothetical protein